MVTTTTETETTVPAARNNNLVAESDLQAALTAIQDRLDLTWERRRQQLSADELHALQPLLTSCSNSLQSNLKRIVQPVSDEAFHLYVHRHLEEANEENERIDEKAPKPTVVKVEEEYDEDELIDKNALKLVQNLREQVRQQAQNVQHLKSQVLDQAVVVAHRQVNLWKNNVGLQDNEDEEDAVVDAANSHQSSLVASKLQEMKVSLSEMTQALQETESKLPGNLESLQETVVAIEEGLKASEQTLSQTEQAIISRDNEGTEFDLDESNMNVDTMHPDERLAHFLRQA